MEPTAAVLRTDDAPAGDTVNVFTTSSTEKAQFNQYWYSPHTVDVILDEIVMNATSVAFLSTPSLYFALKRRCADGRGEEGVRLHQLVQKSKLLEFDRQWETDPGFVFFDYNLVPNEVTTAPVVPGDCGTLCDHLPASLAHAFDYVVVDPPFITEETWKRYMVVARQLLATAAEDTDAAPCKSTGPTSCSKKCTGKALFTTVLENHTMLEALYDGPLFISLFRPSIPRLTYQYSCFLNYLPNTLAFLRENDGESGTDAVEPLSQELKTALEMSNAIRESETAFAAQMALRDRSGEQLLPSLDAVAEKQQRREETAATRPTDASAPGVSATDVVAMEIQAMPWSHIPEGLTMYPEGHVASPSNSASGTPGSAGSPGPWSAGTSFIGTESVEVDFGPEYAELLHQRSLLEAFKKNVDKVQRLLNTMLTLNEKLQAEGQQFIDDGEQPCNTDDSPSPTPQGAEKATDSAFATTKAALAATISDMKSTLAIFDASEVERDAFCATSMRECIAAYTTAKLQKEVLQSIAAEATRKYKSPLFKRQGELLNEMKAIKKNTLQRAV